MTKLKKKLIGLKISRFFKANNFILFFHCNSNSNKDLYAIHAKLSFLNNVLLHGKQANTKWHNASEASTSEMTSLLLKNKIAQKLFAIYAIDSFFTKTIKPKQNSKEFLYKMFAKQKQKKDLQLQYSVEAHNILDKTDITGLHLNTTKSKSRIQKAKIKQLFAIFQGPTVLLAFNNVLFLENVLKISKQENSLVLFGGFYNHKVLLNEKDIQKLADLCKNHWNTLRFIEELQKSTQTSLLVLKKALDFSVLNAPQYKFLRILNIRKQQLALL